MLVVVSVVSAVEKDIEVDAVPPIRRRRWRLRLSQTTARHSTRWLRHRAWLLENGLRATGYVPKYNANTRSTRFAGPRAIRSSERVTHPRRILAAFPDANTPA